MNKQEEKLNDLFLILNNLTQVKIGDVSLSPDEIIDLDKDLIKRGNKEYCPQYCSFVPQVINKLVGKRDKLRGNHPVGVYYDKQLNKYTAKLTLNSKSKHLGCFLTPEEAFYAYKKAKEKHIKKMAWKYKDVLDRRVYQSLMRYRILITD